MKFVPTALAGAVTVALAQFAMAQAPSVDQQGAQNSAQYGSGNQSSQSYGTGNQSNNTYQNGAQNQNAQNAPGGSAQQSQQYGKGNASSQGGTSAYEQNRQSNMQYSLQGAQKESSPFK